ncbi:MAG: alpha/beta hydrolase [Patescibacteria group bacterium]
MIRQEKIPTDNGGYIAAAIHHPPQTTDCLAILCPGWLDSKEYNHLVFLADDLANEGYTVVRFDPTGTWESEGDTPHTVSEYLNDIRSVLEYMLETGSFKHVLLGGHSRGGMVSILYAIRDSRISTVLAIMTPYSIVRTQTKDTIEAWKSKGYRISLRNVPNSKEIKEFRVPYSHAEDAEMYNVLEEVKNLHTPLLLVTGDVDTVVSPDDVKQIYDKANEPKQFLTLEGIGHDYRHNDDEIKIVNEAVLKALESFE